jgi:hypothetical protein
MIRHREHLSHLKQSKIIACYLRLTGKDSQVIWYILVFEIFLVPGLWFLVIV